ncbi:hypothetical protein D9619_001709 [Psilocybe cf. subviscida]|uniref:Uncharacterized protein n=1 Tax=Psilocybe cf. subviscida TaxID=2480587 RepID=A0A8H5BE69_9AGAR|nr:hypothetical protein D9619_001709 [Psilocybe cf. subviscida]
MASIDPASHFYTQSYPNYTMASNWAELNEYEFEAEPGAAYSEKLLVLLNKTLAMEPELGHEKPPLHFLLPTVKGILYPTFVSTLMLDFVRLMTMVEFHRLRVLDKAQTMDEWHIYCEDDDDPDIRFDEQDLTHLREFVAGGPDLRDCFVRMLAQCFREDLERIWITGSNTQFWVRWDDYFSIFKWHRKDSSKAEPFHFKLSPDDVSQFRDAADHVIYFMEATTKYSIFLKEQGNKATPEAIHRLAVDDKNQTTELRDQLQAAVGPDLYPETLDIVEYYLDYISATLPTIYDILHRGDRRSVLD